LCGFYRIAAVAGRWSNLSLWRVIQSAAFAILCTVKNPKDDDLVRLEIQLVHDDVRQPFHRPLASAGDQTLMPEFGKFTKPIGGRANTRDYALSGVGITRFDVGWIASKCASASRI
jgi:hypothetical protein